MPDRAQPNRWRCLATGCNPILDVSTAHTHNQETGHRVAKWPVRSQDGKRRAHIRNRSGYYDKYNVASKDVLARGFYNTGDGRMAEAVESYDDDDQSWDAHKSY